jgi:uncharacterized membrane protein YtjA (UPF0391 family)
LHAAHPGSLQLARVAPTRALPASGTVGRKGRKSRRIAAPGRFWHGRCKCFGQPGRGDVARTDRERRTAMLYYAIVFFVVALIAAALGFGGIAGAATGIAKILFFVFLILFIASLVFGGLRRR